jgi:hypothetical protein
MAIILNGFRVELSSPTATVWIRNVAQPAQMKRLREDFGKDWFLSWHEGRAFAFPRVPSPSSQPGEPHVVDCSDHSFLHVLAARINDVLPHKFPQYRAFRRRPFSFLGQKDEIVQAVARSWPNVPSLLTDFRISPRFELDPRLVEIRRDETAIGLFMKVDMHWQILASVDRLQDAGIDVTGLFVVRRNPAPDERRLIGAIGQVQGEEVILSEAFDDLRTVAVNQVWLEGSRASFARCLRALLGNRYEEFETARIAEEGEFLLGPALECLLGKMDDTLRKASPLDLAPDLNCTFAGRLEITNTTDYQSVIACEPVEYCFDAAMTKRHMIPWQGLLRYGPFSSDTFSKRTPRILVVCPDQASGKVSQFVRAFRDGITSLTDSRYPKGFAGTFALVNPEFTTCTVPILGTKDDRAADTYRRSIEDHLARGQGNYDAALVAILDHHARLPDGISPYLHAKTTLLLNAIPTQEARIQTLSASHASLQWSMQNLAVALYAKMGGVPWTVAHDLTVDDELVIGMGMAELSGSRFSPKQRFGVGVGQKAGQNVGQEERGMWLPGERFLQPHSGGEVWASLA